MPIMKQGIHPQWFPEARVTCACGAGFITGSTLQEIRVEICSKCHPFFTGAQKFVDTLGTVERFQKKQEEAKVKKRERAKIVQAKREKFEEQKREKPTLKELLMQARKTAAS